MMKQQSIRKAPWEKIILYTLASIWAVICLFPIWHLISATFSTDASNITTTFFPNSISNGLDKIGYALNAANILTAIRDTLLYTLVTLAGLVCISALLAYEFTFYKFPGRKLLCCVYTVGSSYG